MIERIAIVNRGEAAMRLIHAVRDLNAARSSDRPITTIALHTEGERRAMFVREADEAYDLGPASARPYLNHEVLERALVDTRADAAWVGWGFVAEDPAFADVCARINVTFIGPSAEAMRRLGDKIGSKLLAEEVGVPVAPWSRGPVNSLDEARRAAEQIGYPLMLKATAGGGGRGIRTLTSSADLASVYQLTRDEAERAFGSPVVFLEKLVTGARHVEVQLIADGQGTAWAIGVRDCSVQRRNQKVIEESASPVMTPQQAQILKDSAERLAVAVGYAGAGTVEFLFQPEDGTFAFLEVNTRLQVEHPITEATTGTDLVKLQIHVAEGGRLTGARPTENGHAIEARLNAEDPDRDFAPAPGHLDLLNLPSGPGIRVDTGVDEGDQIPSDFDSMIAKVIAVGRDRDEALARLRRAMSETHVLIDGGATNKSFILDLLDQAEVIDASADTGWIDRVRGEGRLVANRHSGIALVAAGIEAYIEEETIERTRLFETARGGRPQAQHVVGRPIELKLRGSTYAVTVLQVGPDRFRVTVEAPGQAPHTVDAAVERLGNYASRLTVSGHGYRIRSATHGPTQVVEVDGVTHRISRDEGGVLRSPAPALVVATPVVVGDAVETGAPVLVLESMKMETVLPAPFAATVKEVLVSTGSQVETGAPLLRLEPAVGADEKVDDTEQTIDLDVPECATTQEPALERAQATRRDLSSTLLGFDLDDAVGQQTLQRYLEARDELIADGKRQLADAVGLLSVLADMADLSLNRPGGSEDHSELLVHSPREHFHTYLQSLDADRSKLPDSFREKLTRVLAHYGITGLDRTPELEEAVFRIFLAQQRSAPDVTIGTAILQRWTQEPPPPPEYADEVREILDRLARATQRRFPDLADVARGVRFNWFDQPVVDAERSGVLNAAREQVNALAGEPDAADRDARIAALAAIPEQIVRFLCERLADGIPDNEPMLEVLLRRHYLEWGLTGVGERRVDSRPVAAADYVLDDRNTHVVSTVALIEELAPDTALMRTLTAEFANRAAGQQTVADLYIRWPDAPADDDETSSVLAERLTGLDVIAGTRRTAVAVCGDPGVPVGYFTFRPDGNAGVVEDRLVRGMHPMVGRRLNLWRLRDFDVQRLPAPEDVLLYHCTAKGNPSDERLVAMAQVRQFSIERDEQGIVTSLPHVERAVANCIEGIRRGRAAIGASARLDNNLVWVHVWPVVEAPLEELTGLSGRIAPLSVGAGVEEVAVQGRIVAGADYVVPVVARFVAQPGAGVEALIEGPPQDLLPPLDEYAEKVQRARRRGMVYPYDLAAFIAGRDGRIVEHDLDEDGRLVPVQRAYGLNTAGIIAAVVTTPTLQHPEGITRVLLCGDPTKALGAVAEPECSRIIAAIDLAETMGVPVEWFALSAGARISMDSGTENMDWIARALKRIIEFTQAGGEINVVVAGINVGAQPYWNAEATMLMHTKGILVMTPDSAMVLTGKQSLDFSGGVSAEDNYGIGGYDRVMGPNGQAQYWAPDLPGARDILLMHYDHAYVPLGEHRPRRAATRDPVDRDVTTFPHTDPGSEFRTVGDIFSMTTNPDRKKPFDIRTLMRAVTDQDHETLERWAGMADAETAVVWDAHMGGIPVCLIGIESKSVPRRGFPPTDGPDVYTAGTLFPRSSKKVARAINAASGNRPLVVLANLSGFDGSPDSMRNLQLEYGAQIGRAIVNFTGPIVFVVVSRYHGGAFVVFSKALNPRMTVLAVQGSFASVIGGAPAAAVVFSRDVDKQTAADPRVAVLAEQVNEATGAARAKLSNDLASLRTSVRAEKISEVAAHFDGVHNIHRAVEVGSVDEVIAAAELRPRIIRAVEEGLD
ncbi:MAG: carboxyl transferase domain-containing protein [Nostocoides sp.]